MQCSLKLTNNLDVNYQEVSSLLEANAATDLLFFQCFQGPVLHFDTEIELLSPISVSKCWCEELFSIH